jgi:hypothetical protein
MNAPARILAVAALCVASLVGLVVYEGTARSGGQEILLPMEAVDPRSLLSGHYVQLNLTQRLAGAETCPAAGDWKWIALRPHADVYELQGGAASRDGALALGPLPVKGSFECSPPTPMLGVEPLPGWVRLDIGVERFHINQTDALRIEQVLRDQNVNEATRAYAIVSIGRDGRARLKGLMIDGERLELTWL